jgi:beta-aspartyl-peptidase (threonine type)
MRPLLPLFFAMAAMTAHAQTPAAAPATSPDGTLTPQPIALVIHGGAGVMERAELDPERERAIRADLDRALDAGYAVLARHGSAMDAVQAAILVLEESPHFNAGKGAVFDAEGHHQLDASMMEGHTRRAGAVAGVRTIRNPILLARAVMERSRHVMLAGDGAEAFADTLPDIERVPNTWFDTEHRRRQLEEAQARERAQTMNDVPGTYFGTVGAVALDRDGHIAAGTSTGGMTNKRWNRIGDSPVIGAGTWADDRCGVSGTGWGEFYIRAAVAHDICARVAYSDLALATAAHQVVNVIVPELGGDGGAIALDREGNIEMPFNTSGMYRGWINPDGSRGTAIFRDDASDD